MQLHRAPLAFQVAGGDSSEYLVSRFRGTEGLCRLFRFEIELVSSDSPVEFDDLVGREASLTVDNGFGERRFHGIIGHFEVTGETRDRTYYRVELVPKVWLLTHRYGSRIAQQMSVPDIISDVLVRAGISSDRFRLNLEREYPLRDYCVQYRETDFNYICRLMEEEGIWWYFEQEEDDHVLVLADSPAGYSPIDGSSALAYRPPSGMNTSGEHLLRFRLGRSVRPGAVTLRDFSFKNPRLDLQTGSDTDHDQDLEFSDYPGEYDSQSRGTELARLRAEEFEASRTVGYGQSNCHRLVSGRTFEVSRHPQETLNSKYLLTSVTHEGKQATSRSSTGTQGQTTLLDARVHQSLMAARQSEIGTVRELAEGLLQIASSLEAGDPTAHRALTAWVFHAGQVSRDPAAAAGASGGNPLDALAIPNLLEDLARSPLVDRDSQAYACTFECIPAEVTYRPPRITPWPVMRGSQTARVVGPEREEIYTDEYGRVKVQFHWDRQGRFDENSSCWIRVSQGMAGGQYGMMFLPRVGQEVIVDFLEGDPDQPIITGRVYNKDHMPPYALPDERTRSCIKTRSSPGGGGGNEIRFEDRKDQEQFLLFAQRDLHVRVKNDRVENVEHDRHLTVDENKFELVKKSKSAEVRLDFSEKIGGTKSLEVVGDVGEAFKSNHSESVGGNYYMNAGKSVVIEAGSELTLKVGGNFIKIDDQGITILGTVVNINSGGSAGVGTAIALKPPGATLTADDVLPGRDVTYTGGEDPAPPPPEQPRKKPSWIEIELVDEVGQPVPYEYYEIIGPDGKTIRQGTLDENGLAHEPLSDPGTCQISFPRLDAAAWDRAAGTPAGGLARAVPAPPPPATGQAPVSPAAGVESSDGEQA